MTKLDKLVRLLAILSLLALVLPACGGGDEEDDLTGPGNGGGGGEVIDTTPPQVASIFPPGGELDTFTDEMIVISFNEPMDPNSAPGQITTSHGSITELIWTTETSLLAEHTSWPEGTQVTVSVGTGLTDLAGNHLAAPQSATFFTYSSQAALMAHTPADGTVNFNRAGIITLQFSETMMTSSLESGITLTDESGGDIAFTVTYDPEDQYLYRLHPTSDLPASTVITVAVTAAVLGVNGNPLPSPVTFSFTTGLVADVTPPVIVSIDPASGATIPHDLGAVTVTFDEPVAEGSLNVVAMNGQLAWVAAQTAQEPYLDSSGTVLTFPLSDLPAGIPLSATLANFSDAWGNTQTERTSWSVTVAGTADEYPLVDGQRFIMRGEESEGSLGNSFPDNTYEGTAFYETAARPTAGEWEWREYEWDYSILDYYDILSVSADRIRLLGFGEDLNGNGNLTEIMANPPVTFAELPYTAGGSWSGNTSFTESGETFAAAVSGSVVGQVDLPVTDLPPGEFDGVEITWSDVWQVTRSVSLTSGSTLIATEEITFWIAPGIGVVRQQGREDNLAASDEPGWFEYDRWLVIGNN